jgi:hypothetical protein
LGCPDERPSALPAAAISNCSAFHSFWKIPSSASIAALCKNQTQEKVSKFHTKNQIDEAGIISECIPRMYSLQSALERIQKLKPCHDQTINSFWGEQLKGMQS